MDMRTYEGSRESVLLLGSVDDLQSQLDQGARVHVCEDNVAKSRVDERFEMAFLGTLRAMLDATFDRSTRTGTHCLHQQKGGR
jgi:hypothetical protein